MFFICFSLLILLCQVIILLGPAGVVVVVALLASTKAAPANLDATTVLLGNTEAALWISIKLRA